MCFANGEGVDESLGILQLFAPPSQRLAHSGSDDEKCTRFVSLTNY
jgi:hypothetical protein